MKEDLLKTIEFEKFAVLLKDLMESGYGEIQYRVVIINKNIATVSLTKTDTYKPERDTI